MVDGSPLELISPCLCRSVVHRKCLNHWRATSNTYNAMTHCPTCKEAYETIATAQVVALERPIFWAQVSRVIVFAAIVLVGSWVVLLVDAGTPKFMNLHWNALDGKIYAWVGLPSVPRYLVYVVLSLAMTLIVMAIVWVLRWCARSRFESYNCDCTLCCFSCDHHDHQHTSCHDCGCGDGCGDCDGGCSEAMVIVVVVAVVLGVFIGVAMLIMALVGGIANAVDSAREKRIRSLQVQQTSVRNLRTITSV
ncbi:hypothetical protein DYB32_007179 [Aphanomyces invadans]|uniref:RING-CH-type domain-containing protein n=1 Tax=Aphanomyces invadans TaxID=157072 RepID=A0A418AQT2_9STRA|nr:hypothetical protein DYB32_007179 [Aphanomyces invadans]